MKNMFKSNKKGFTLVELLAVIVILALLIVITANTVLPMMTKSRKTGMLVYAERVLANAATAVQADSITQSSASSGFYYYSIAEIMGNDEYYGCVAVYLSNGKTDYAITMYDSNNKLKLEGKLPDGKSAFSKAAEDIVLPWTDGTSYPEINFDNFGETSGVANTTAEEECGKPASGTASAQHTAIKAFISKTSGTSEILKPYSELNAQNQL